MKLVTSHQKVGRRHNIGKISRFLAFYRFPGNRNKIVVSTVLVIVAAILSATAFGPAETSADPLAVSERTTDLVPPNVDAEAWGEIGLAAGNGAETEAGGPPTGSGVLQFSREDDFDHSVAAGETLSEIAYIYQVDTLKLAAYNYITNIHSIRVGDLIRIPSLAKEKHIAQRNNIAMVRTSTSLPATVSDGVLPSLVIAAQEQYDGQAVTAHFFVQSPTDQELDGFEWQLGNRDKSFRPDVFWSFSVPGTYRVSLRARASGRLIESNEILIDVPHPATFKAEYQSFITLSSVREQFALQGELLGVLNYRDLDSAPIEVISSNFDSTIYRFTRTGYFTLAIEHDDIRSNVYVFVSPIESVHVDRSELNWYRTQFNTGAQSNCGPSTVSMAAAWTNGDYVPVSTIRQQVGWHEERLGATTLEELSGALQKNDVNVRFQSLYSKEDLTSVIDNGNIAIVLFETGDIPWVDGHPLQSVFGRYYTYTQGHYVIIKGYSADRKYFIVYDPIPSDWGSNSLRYADGISMMGRNRYYPADTLLRSIRNKRSQFLEIWR